MLKNLKKLGYKFYVVLLVLSALMIIGLFYFNNSEISREKYLSIESKKPYSTTEKVFLKQALEDGKISVSEEIAFQKIHDETIKIRLIN